jgi:hypothetical protein
MSGATGLGIAARDALRRALSAAMQAGGTKRPAGADLDRLMAYAIDQVEHAMVLDRIAIAMGEQDPHG